MGLFFHAHPFLPEFEQQHPVLMMILNLLEWAQLSDYHNRYIFPYVLHTYPES